MELRLEIEGTTTVGGVGGWWARASARGQRTPYLLSTHFYPTPTSTSKPLQTNSALYEPRSVPTPVGRMNELMRLLSAALRCSLRCAVTDNTAEDNDDHGAVQ